MTLRQPTYVLDDPRPAAASAPYTYFLPLPEYIDALQAGDLVKLVVRSVPQSAKWDAERLWVEVRNIDGECFLGALENQPRDIPGLAVGDVIQFQRWHIVSTLFSRERTARLPTDTRREYWDRCVVDQCVLDGEAKVAYLYREKPDLAQTDDEFADSGWRIRGESSGIARDEKLGQMPAYVALGAALNRDDSWLHLIDEPEGSAFDRNFNGNSYVVADKT